MDVYEFTQALRRQARLLIVGTVLLVIGVFMMTFDVSSGGLEPRVPPSYEASVRMVITEADATSLSDASTSDLGGEASFFVTILGQSETKAAIIDAAGMPAEDLTFYNEGSVITAKAVAATPEAAVQIALTSYDWLEAELANNDSMVPDDIVSDDVEATETPTTPTAVALDENGLYVTEVSLQASSAYDEMSGDVWVVLTAAGEEIKAAPLAYLGREEGVSSTEAAVDLEGELTISIEDPVRNQYDQMVVSLPELPSSGEHRLRITLDRGAVVPELKHDPENPLADPEVIGATASAEHVETEWRGVTPTASYGVIQLTTAPSASLTGDRRGPILTLAALFGGLFALIVLAVAVDSWRQAHRSRKTTAYNDRLAIIRPIDGGRRYDGDGALSFRINVTDDDDDKPPRLVSGSDSSGD